MLDTHFSTSDMAQDVIALLDYIEWTGKRQVHVVGVSLGGMIAMGMHFLFFTRDASVTSML